MTRKIIRRRKSSEEAESTPQAEVAPAQPQAPEAPTQPAAKRRSRQRVLAKPKTEKKKRKSAPKPVDPSSITSARLSELEALASMDGDPMADLLGMGGAAPRRFEPGTKVSGIVTRLTREDVYVDLSAKSEGWLPIREIGEVSVGDTIEAFVVSSGDYGIRLSARLSGEAAEDFLEDAADAGIPVEGKVVSRNAGGYEVRVGTVRAFCPRSMISRIPLVDPDSILGETHSFKVLETGDKIVVSRRALQEEQLEGARERFWETVSEGDLLKGIVISVQPWGAFLDLDGMEALLPRSEFGWEKIDNLTTRLSPGMRLDVRVHELSASTGKVTLSTRDPNLNPWTLAKEQFAVGDIVNGKVISQAEFGVFVEIAPALQGLVHRSKLGGKLPAPATQLEVRIDGMDLQRQRLDLSPKDYVKSDRVDAEPSEDGVGQTVVGTVGEVLRNGAVIHLEDGRSGWLPAREVDLPAGTVMSQRFRVGRKVSAFIQSIDPKRGRLNLTMKEAGDDDRSNWQSQPGSDSASMGTMADLFSKLKR